MAKTNSTNPAVELPPVAQYLLEEVGRGNFEPNHLHAADAVEMIADMLSDRFNGSDTTLTDRQAEGLCSALHTISRWYSLEAQELSERACQGLERLEGES